MNIANKLIKDIIPIKTNGVNTNKIGIHIGAKTQIQEIEIYPVAFNINKVIVNKPKNPIPPEEEFLTITLLIFEMVH